MKAAQYRKKGIALMYLAKKFFLINRGDRVPTVDEFCAESGLSRGTVQNALEMLKDDGAINTVSKGHLGTFLQSVDQDLLLNYFDNRTLVGAMPLPYTKHYEGLATGLYQAFTNRRLHLSLAYMSGSFKRLEGLLANRYDFILTSGLTADSLIQDYPVQIVMSLPAQTYLTEHVLLFPQDADMEIHDGMRIGVDSNSLDYAILTQEILHKHNVVKVETPYNQIVKQIEGKKIDAAIWNRDEVMSKNYPVAYKSIDSPLIKRGSQAVLLSRKDDQLVSTVLSQYLSAKSLLDVQEGVLSDRLLPEY